MGGCKTIFYKVSRQAPPGGTGMTLHALITLLIVGAIAGWGAGQIVKGYGYGLIGNIIVGVIGAFLASWLLPRIGVHTGGGLVGQIIGAFVGSVILLFILGLFRR
jgi:uncharacterized membrane protein YeaQ/YmgE (transglycosylase-associated protein family)